MANNIDTVDIVDEASESYMEYALSTIISRALPEIRDGLKPVQRRILYAMKEDSLYPTSPHVKSVSIVGDTLKKFHPHGDTSVYETMVHMAQDFNFRYPLVDGQGNFGSINNPDAAAARYTEARMSQYALYCASNIEEDVVEFIDNFDGRYKEPTVLPVEFPNLLCNGSFGIAVGMSTAIPPHNLNEVLDATITLIKNPKARITTLLKHINGPDFPSGAYILGSDRIKKIYTEGASTLILQAKITVEDCGNDGKNIVVTELPYRISPDKIEIQISKIKADDNGIKGIGEVKNFSDSKTGTHLVIEVAKNHNHEVVLEQLLDKTDLRTNERVCMRVVDEGIPRIVNVKEVLQAFIDFRFEVTTNFIQYRLDDSEKAMLIQQGFDIILQDIDAAIKIIKGAEDKGTAAKKLQSKYKLVAEQTEKILDMPLSRLTKIEVGAVKKKIDELQNKINEYKKILADKKKIAKYIINRLREVKKELGDDRRSEIIDKEPEKINVKDLIGTENMVIALSSDGYIKRTPLSEYRAQKRGGKGSTTLNSDDDFIEDILISPLNFGLLFFTNQAKVHYREIYKIPQAGRRAKGVHLNSMLYLGENETVNACLAVDSWETDDSLLLVTANGTIKKTDISDYSGVVKRSKGLVAFGLAKDDEVCRVLKTNNSEDILIITKNGNAIRFSSSIVRASGRQATGVKGIELDKRDAVVDAGIVDPKDKGSLLIVTENGKCKKTKLSEYQTRVNRAGKGIIAAKLTKGDTIASMEIVAADDSIIVVTSANKTLRHKCSNIKDTGRNTQGVNLIDLDDGDYVVETSLIKIDGKV